MEPVLLLQWRPDRQSRTLLKRSQTDQDRSPSVEEDLQIYPSNLVLKVRTVQLCRSTDTDNISEVADMEVDAHQVTGPAVADYTINKPQSGRAASHKLQRQGAVIDLNLLASVASTRAHAPNEVISQQMYILIFNCLISDTATN